MTNWDSLIGKPLQYKGIYQLHTHAPMTADFHGRGYGPATIYTIANSKEEALEKAKNEEFIVDDNSIIDDDIDWDTDIENIDIMTDMLADNLYDEEGDGDSFKVATDVDSYMLHSLMLQDKLTPH